MKEPTDRSQPLAPAACPDISDILRSTRRSRRPLEDGSVSAEVMTEEMATDGTSEDGNGHRMTYRLTLYIESMVCFCLG